MVEEKSIAKPIQRSKMRAALGMTYYGLLRRLLWLKMHRQFATQISAPLSYVQFAHKTPLLRKLKDVDMQYQYQKITNLKLAAKKLSGIVVHPGEIFSYWRLLGRPTKHKGYVEGLVLHNGTFGPGIGGGLCQMSNLIFWMALHTPLTVVERHRHGYDVFPDANRTQPFGSGATCFYPHGDLMLQNNTEQDYQLIVTIGDTFLHGEWRTSSPPACTYAVEERNHCIKSEYWGGYTRCNKLYRQCFDLNGILLWEQLAVSNSALMMYAPFLGRRRNRARQSFANNITHLF